MGVNSLPKTVNRQRRGCDLKPGPTAPESSTLTARLPSRPDPYSRKNSRSEVRQSGNGRDRARYSAEDRGSLDRRPASFIVTTAKTTNLTVILQTSRRV